MQADIGAVMPFRYVQPQNMPEGTTTEDLTAGGKRQIAVHYPIDDNAADFVCSDEKLSQAGTGCPWADDALVVAWASRPWLAVLSQQSVVLDRWKQERSVVCTSEQSPDRSARAYIDGVPSMPCHGRDAHATLTPASTASTIFG
jgi:hypothetical protein